MFNWSVRYFARALNLSELLHAIQNLGTIPLLFSRAFRLVLFHLVSSLTTSSLLVTTNETLSNLPPTYGYGLTNVSPGSDSRSGHYSTCIETSGTSRHPDQCPCRITNIRKTYTVQSCIHPSTGTPNFSLLFKTLQRRMSSSSLHRLVPGDEIQEIQGARVADETTDVFILIRLVSKFLVLYRSLNRRDIYRYTEAIRLFTSILSCVSMVPYVRLVGRSRFTSPRRFSSCTSNEIFERPTHEHLETL